MNNPEFHIPYVNVFSATHLEYVKGGVIAHAVDGTPRKIRSSNLIFVEEMLMPDTGEIRFRVSHLRYWKHNTDVVGSPKPSNVLDGGSKIKTASGMWIHYMPDFIKIKQV